MKLIIKSIEEETLEIMEGEDYKELEDKVYKKYNCVYDIKKISKVDYQAMVYQTERI